MLIVTMLAGLILIGVILVTLDYIFDISSYYFSFWVTNVISFVVGVVGLLISIILILSVHIKSDIDYQNTLAKKQMLEYRVDKQKDIAGNELLYSEIVSFNNSLRSVKTWANNPWTNWFYNQDVANKIDYIIVE